MGILAEMALRRARGRLNSVQSRAAPKAPVKAEVSPTRSEVVVTGPINRFMFLEGRSWAIDMVTSLRASPVAVVVDRLAGAAVDRPGSYAAGIESVIKELKECSQ
ncbi:hypothetical protein M6G63_18805 [Pseudomonas sp. BYT-5]|uniref:hypothetical protein n=1 Tax=unclassified Pseudomonas TaxID=196821 RepID=UPI00202244D7|nr:MULTISPECIES: hypothetical protein [unclassified Pseudomonas]URD41475.1 hypothetical protein M6G63_18805 [Pseudomonas sp. BYT-5]URK96826.1 hypothetical protein J5X93_19470 [Pseudomonas sp. BYT-1]